jgi:hypothetical protein
MIYYDKDNIIVRESTNEDVEFLKNRLRFEDIAEIWASHNHTPEKALRLSLEYSDPCLTIEDNGKPVGMFGVTPESMLGNKAVIWLLASDDIEKIKIRFLRNCKIFINSMLNQYPYLYNFIDERNKESIKWLKFLGASFSGPVKFGVEQMPFLFFSFERAP